MEQAYESIPKLEDYDVSPKTGFVMENLPTVLPEYFSAWNYIDDNLPALLENHTLRDYVHKMPQLDHTKLESKQQWILAYSMLSIAVAAYINCEGKKAGPRILPAQLAVPWCGVCDHLGLERIYSATAQVLCNYKLLDDSKPATIENTDLRSFYVRDNADWVIRMNMQAEINAGPAVQAVITAMEAVIEKDDEKMACALDVITQHFKKVCRYLLIIHEHVGKKQWLDAIKFMSGWGGVEYKYFDGVIYEGVTAEPQTSPAANGGQTPVVTFFDVALGVDHKPDLIKHQNGERRPWFPQHRKFTDIISKGPSIKKYVYTSGNQKVKDEYTACLNALQELRAYHLQLVSKYHLSFLIDLEKMECEHSGIEYVEGQGSKLFQYLKDMKNDTKSKF